jgi:Cu(I)/Ag(I) efflux system protein CusF
MKRITALAFAFVISLSGALPAGAQSAATPHRTTGVVKSVDAAKGTVSIAHAAVPELKWPAMTMGFSAADRKLLQNLQPGAKVEFEFVQQGSRYVIVSIN